MFYSILRTTTWHPKTTRLHAFIWMTDLFKAFITKHQIQKV